MKERTKDMIPLESRLPEDREYWEALADRIVADSAPVLAGLRGVRGAWWGTLAQRAPALAAAAAVAIAAGSIALASSGSPGESPYSEVARAIGPSDAVGRLFTSEPGPPTVETLMPVLARGETDR